ncbi:MAG: transcription termination factor NusA, partial [Pseudomonadota bacterium]
MNKEILTVVDMVSNEKGVSKDIIFEALESALVSATKKKYRQGAEMDIQVKIDRQSGDYSTARRWEVMTDEDYCEPERHLIIEDIQDKHPGAALGDFIEEPMESVAFGRIAAQTARQVIVQKVREAERAQIAEAYRGQVGELINGVVKRLEKGNLTIDLGSNAEALVMRENLIPREAIRPGDRIRAYLREVKEDSRGPQLILSRIDPEFLIELFKLEVPEIGENLVEVLSAARDPGLRAKIAVRAHDPRIDPVGACVGMRGSRVQAVTN